MRCAVQTVSSRDWLGEGEGGTLWSNDTLALYMYINALYLHLTIGDSSPTDTETGQNDFADLEQD
jgi:hypothetical protein